MARRINTQTFHREQERGHWRQHDAAWRGYNDALRELPFSEWYQATEKLEQFAYETGRAWITNMRAAGIDPPAWPNPGPPPVAVTDANTEATRREESYALPWWGALPPTNDPVFLEPGSNQPRGRRRRRH